MNTNEVYALADMLQMELHLDDRTITGQSKDAALDLGQTKLPMDCRVITSYAPISGAAVVVKIMGDLGLLMTAEGTLRSMHRTMSVLDLSKLPARGERLIENAASAPRDLATIRLMVLPAVISSFIRAHGKEWAEAL